MRARARSLRGLLGGVPVALALAASSACELVRPVDPLEAHPDVVAIAVLLVAGETEARMLAVHPHREWKHDVPVITGHLQGPGWTAEFSETVKLTDCGELGAGWQVPSRCLRATLPEAIQPGVEYGLEGVAPLGSFTGETSVPEPSVLVEPAYTLYLSQPSESGLVDIPIRYVAGLETGTLLVDLYDVVEVSDSGELEEIPISQLGPFPTPLANAEADTISVYQDARPLGFHMRLLGIGWNYTNFAKYVGIDPLPRPWPSFGIDGEGVYGYFDGIVGSVARRVFIGQPGRSDRG